MLSNRFNPLHCGAVVASRGGNPPAEMQLKFQSPSLRGSGRFAAPGRADHRLDKFQSPSLRGSGRFDPDAGKEVRVSVLFQSPSLRGSGRFQEAAAREAAEEKGFNPLHCGAVVASGAGGCGGEGPAGFNPLHCGAVVAS